VNPKSAGLLSGQQLSTARLRFLHHFFAISRKTEYSHWVVVHSADPSDGWQVFGPSFPKQSASIDYLCFV